MLVNKCKLVYNINHIFLNDAVSLNLSMFTGIIETTGVVVATEDEGTNRHFAIRSVIGRELKVDQSVSHDGVCLTVTRVENDVHWVTAIRETLERTTLSRLNADAEVNLERCMLNNGRFDGHIVQGHVDQVGIITTISDQQGSWLFGFEYDAASGHITVEKGSICVNGVSLTCFDVKDNGFSVAVIPYTHAHTTFRHLKAGDQVNLEFDIIGKYVQRLLARQA